MPAILLVEDNLLNKELVYIFLKDIYTLDYAPDGHTAIEMANKNVYTAILMDINLRSDMDGIQVAEEIKKISGYKNVPIAAVTGYTSGRDILKISKSVCSYYLGKPFDKCSLLKLVDDMINKYNSNISVNNIITI
jgi:CheY-like chemotaxis protein